MEIGIILNTIFKNLPGRATDEPARPRPRAMQLREGTVETSNYEGWTPGVDAWERRRVQHEDLRRSLRDHFVGRGYKTEWAEGVGEVKEKGGMVGGAEDGTREGGRWRCTKMSSPTVFQVTGREEPRAQCDGTRSKLPSHPSTTTCRRTSTSTSRRPPTPSPRCDHSLPRPRTVRARVRAEGRGGGGCGRS